MALNSVYKKYFQKSKVFIYPLLGIKRGSSVVPTETYLSWNESYAPEDMKLVCVYQSRTDAEYIQFEKNVLLKHTRLNDYIKINDNTTVAIFENVGDVALDQMLRDFEISAKQVTVNPVQNVLTTSKLIVAVTLVINGVARNIEIPIGFKPSIA